MLATTQTSKVQRPVLLPNDSVYAHKLVVFAWDNPGRFALVTSDVHRQWVFKYGSTLETRPVYTPSDVFDTFPQPVLSQRTSAAGAALETYRRQLMLDQQIGLTALYNQFDDPANREQAVERLRDLHIEIDRAVADAYGWDRVPLEHGFHDTRQGVRFTISAVAREAILGRLLDLNHRRHAEEVAATGGVLDL